MDIWQFMKRKSISVDGRNVENNSDKRFQKRFLFNQHWLMRETQTQLLIVQVHFRLSCMVLTMITTFMHQFSKSCNGWH